MLSCERLTVSGAPLWLRSSSKGGVSTGGQSLVAGLAATVKELREAGSGYGTIATKLGITSSKVRRILEAV